VGNSLLCQAGLGIRKLHTQGKNLKALMTEVKLLEATINFRSQVDQQEAIHSTYDYQWWWVELLKYYILETKANSSVETTIIIIC